MSNVKNKRLLLWNHVWSARIVLETSEIDSGGNFTGELYFDFFLNFFFHRKKYFWKVKKNIFEFFSKSENFQWKIKKFNVKSKIFIEKIDFLTKFHRKFSIKNFVKKSIFSMKMFDFTLNFLIFIEIFQISKRKKNIFFHFSKLFFSTKKKVEKKSKYSSPSKFPQESISDVFRTIRARQTRFRSNVLFF